jgi:hypothetical protein
VSRVQTFTDAQLAAALNLEISQWQRARRQGLIPPPAIDKPRPRWTTTQLAALLGERRPGDPAAAEVAVVEAIERAREKARAS